MGCYSLTGSGWCDSEAREARGHSKWPFTNVMLQVSEWLQQAVGHETMLHVPKQGQAMSSRSQEQPEPQGETDRWAHHETMPQVSEGGWSQEGSHVQARDRRIGTPCRVRLDMERKGRRREKGE